MASYTKTEIANLTLSFLGEPGIENLDTDTSKSGKMLKRLYPVVLAKLLREFPWAWSRRVETLVKVADDPTTEWEFSYRYNYDVVDVVRILSGSRIDDEDTEVPFEIAQDATGKLIYTNQEDAAAKVVFIPEDLADAHEDFILGFAYELAVVAAPGIVREDFPKLMERLRPMRDEYLQKAKGLAANEEAPGKRPDNSFKRARA